MTDAAWCMKGCFRGLAFIHCPEWTDRISFSTRPAKAITPRRDIETLQEVGQIALYVVEQEQEQIMCSDGFSLNRTN